MNDALVIAITRLGDLIQTEPMIRAIKRDSFTNHVTVLTEKSFAPVVQLFSSVDEIAVVDFGVILGKLDQREPELPLSAYCDVSRWLEEKSFSAVYNLTHSRPSMMLAALAKPMAEGVTLSHDLTQVVNSRWLQYFFATNLARPWCSFNLVDIYVNAVAPLTSFEDRTPFIGAPNRDTRSPQKWSDIECVLHVGASQSDKQWPLDKFVSLCRDLLARGVGVTLIGGAKSEVVSNAFPKHCKFCDRTGQTSIADLIDLFGSADILISADSGPVHVAASCKLPIIAIEGGSAHGFETAPYIENAFVIQPHLENVVSRTPGKKFTSASAEMVSKQTVLSIFDLHFGESSDIVVSEGCTVYKTFADRAIPGLGLRAIAGGHSKYEEWQQRLREFWWHLIGARHAGVDPSTTELALAAQRSASAAKMIRLQTMDVSRLKNCAAALSQAERDIQNLIGTHPPLHCLNSFLQIARGSVSGETAEEQALELEELYSDFAGAAHILLPPENQSNNKKITNYNVTEAIV